MRIASWNVNSIKARLDIVTGWLANDPCDVLLIQETKSHDVNFPIDAFQPWAGMSPSMARKYNGVAIASRFPIKMLLLGCSDPR